MSVRHEMTIPGAAVPQSRPRVTVRGGRARAYHAGPIVEWKETLRGWVSKHAPRTRLAPPISVGIVFEYVRPASQVSKRDGSPLKGWQSIPFPRSRDLDNLAKPVLDVMTECGWWDDDGSVSELLLCKRFGDGDRVIVTVNGLEKGDAA